VKHGVDAYQSIKSDSVSHGAYFGIHTIVGIDTNGIIHNESAEHSFLFGP